MKKETMQQYTRRLLGYLGRKDPLRVMVETPRRLAQLVHEVPKRELLRRPRPGKWSVGEIVAHLAETELVMGWRYRIALTRSGCPIQAFDQEAFARAANYRRIDPDHALELFTVLREANLALLRSTPRHQWSRYGVHEERGKETVRHMARLEAGHDLNHLMQVERIVRRAARR